MSVLIVQHANSEGPGLIGEFLENHNQSMKIVNVSDTIPDPTVHEAIVILGGPQSANDKDKYLRDERLMIRKALMLKKPVLGICLGAQIIAHTFGAKITRSPVSEYGVMIAEVTPEGRQDRFLGLLPRRFPVFQWHKETFEIPADGVFAARGSSCKNQAFSFKTALGIQFHIESTLEIVKAMTEAHSKDLETEGIQDWEIIEEFKKNEFELEQLCNDFCTAFFKIKN